MSAPADPQALPVARLGELETSEPGRRWLLDGLWGQAAVGVVGGSPKSCKTWLGLDMALSVASGTPCLDAFAATDPGGALVYLAEDSLATVKERFTGLCLHRGLDPTTLPIHVITARTLRLDLDRDRLRLEETIRRLGPRMLLLDPFVRLHQVNENDAGEVSRLLAFLRELQREHDMAVIVVHHVRKNGGANAGQSLRGSGDLHAWTDSALYLRRQREGIVLTIEHRSAPAPPPMTLNLVTDEDSLAPHLALASAPPPAPTERRARADLDAIVLRALAAHPEPVSRAYLRATLRVRNETLGDVLAALATAGQVIRQGDRWALAPGSVPVPTSHIERTRNGTG